MTAFPQEGLDRLAERVVAGEVVFFVGSGFSVDSEGNDTGHLVGRLLARFDAMTGLLMGRRPGALADCARELRHGLRVTFSLGDPLTTPGHVATLVRERLRAFPSSSRTTSSASSTFPLPKPGKPCSWKPWGGLQLLTQVARAPEA